MKTQVSLQGSLHSSCELCTAGGRSRERGERWGGAFPRALQGGGFRGRAWGRGEKRAGPMSLKSRGDLGWGERSVARPDACRPTAAPFQEVFGGKACSHKSKPMTQPTIESLTPPTKRPQGVGQEPNHQTRGFFWD